MRDLIGVLALVLGTQGCALMAVDADGTRHVFGFVQMTLPPPALDVGADAIRVRSAGLSVLTTPVVGSSLVLGYADLTIAAMRNHSSISMSAFPGASIQPAKDPK